MLKYLFPVLLLVISSGNVLCQTLTGIVYDENNNVMPGVSVYLNGTTIGTITDKYGRYKIVPENKINTELIISFLGYQTVIIKNPFDKSDYHIQLKPKILELPEVVVHAGKFSRDQMLKIFRKQFLWTTKAGKSCKIKNEDDILLKYDYKTKTLTASSEKPLIIENPFLGYLIDFNLVDFNTKFQRKRIITRNVLTNFFSGTTLFKDIGNNDESILNRRKITYTGSSMHFFRNLYANMWSTDEFLLYKSNRYILYSNAINPDDYFNISDTLGMKKIIVLKNNESKTGNKSKNSEDPFFCSLFILYDHKELSNIIFQAKTLFVDKFGNYTPLDRIVFRGALANQGVGDWLPIDFKLDK